MQSEASWEDYTCLDSMCCSRVHLPVQLARPSVVQWPTCTQSSSESHSNAMQDDVLCNEVLHILSL